MARVKFQTLTEQMFYVLLCLRQECCGMDLMERIRAVTGDRVRVGPGTLYHLLDQFMDAGLIRLTRENGRRKSYMLTGQGEAVLAGEYARLRSLTQDYERQIQTGVMDDE